MLKVINCEIRQNKKSVRKGDRLLFLCGLPFFKVFDLSSSRRKKNIVSFLSGKVACPLFFFRGGKNE
jgi:hypothetical protein